jgi:phospholipid/cholesterol/gamma-HCH transport system substrate-binding protein
MRLLRRVPGEILGISAFVALSLVLTLLVANTLSYGQGDRTTYVAEFTDASGVSAGDEVRIAGVRVGRVESRELDGDVARVRFSVDADQTVHADTVVRVSYLNLLGHRYLALERPDAAAGAAEVPAAQDPAEPIGTDRTSPALDLTQLFNAFKPLFETLDPADVNTVAEQLVAAAQGQGEVVATLTAQVADLTTHLADREDVITQVVANTTTVMTALDDRRDDLTAVVDSLASLTDALATDAGQIDAAVVAVDRLTGTVADVVDRAGPSVTAALTSMSTVGQTMIGGLVELEAATRDLPVMLDAYARSMSYGSWLNIYICSIGIGIDGVPLVPDVAPGSEVCR